VTPRDVYLVTEHGGRDVTRRKEEARDACSREEKIRQRDDELHLAICCDEDIVKKHTEDIEDTAKCIGFSSRAV